MPSPTPSSAPFEQRWLPAAHATAVAGAVAAWIYLGVAPFIPVLESLGPDLSLSGRILVAGQPFPIVLPLAAAAGGLLLGPGSRWNRLLVLLSYLVSLGIAALILLVLYVPAYELS